MLEMYKYNPYYCYKSHKHIRIYTDTVWLVDVGTKKRVRQRSAGIHEKIREIKKIFFDQLTFRAEFIAFRVIHYVGIRVKIFPQKIWCVRVSKDAEISIGLKKINLP
jgi:hypothetical protein